MSKFWDNFIGIFLTSWLVIGLIGGTIGSIFLLAYGIGESKIWAIGLAMLVFTIIFGVVGALYEEYN